MREIIGGWLPIGPYEQSIENPFGWFSPDGFSHIGEWKKKKDGTVIWKSENPDEWDEVKDFVEHGDL